MLPLFIIKEENSILVAAMIIYIYNFELENSTEQTLNPILTVGSIWN